MIFLALFLVPALLTIAGWVLWIREPDRRGARSWMLLAALCAITLSMLSPTILIRLHGPFSSYSMLPMYFILASPVLALAGLMASLIGKGQGRILTATAAAIIAAFWGFAAFMLRHVSFH
jgi:hypothetical protein